jgi:hypothetical protein
MGVSFTAFLKTKPKSSIPGRTFFKGATYTGCRYGVQRTHRQIGKFFSSLSMVKEVAKSLNTAYARREGPECIIPARKEPLSWDML